MTNSNEEDTFKILIATDIHLGYGEKDRIREQDSFITFEEILKHAQTNEVDFILLGGDLFHDAKPSPYCIKKCLELLRTYCLGDRPVGIEFLSDQSYNFQNLTNPIVNYEDPNLNVAIPVFSIHGNHDDPTGSRQVSALDLLATSGLVNYFGRWHDLSKVEIRPILLRKGTTKLALYGLSHIRDERLGRLFRDKKVIMSQPKTQGWFNMFVLHQNRVPHGSKNFIPETALPDFLDLVIWGHEHDCRIEPEYVNGVAISQPGSSVATSLAEGESIPKKIGLLKIHGQQHTMIPIPLKTVRPFLFDEFELEDPNSNAYRLDNPKEQAIKQVEAKIREMITQAANEFGKALPLIRLKVFYHDPRQEFNPIQVGQHFADRVANPEDIIKLLSLKAKAKRKAMNFNDDDEGFDQFINTEEWASSVEQVLEKYYEENKEKFNMKVLSVKQLTQAVSSYVQKSDLDAIATVVDYQTEKTMKTLQEQDPDVDNVERVIAALMRERLEANSGHAEQEMEEILTVLADQNRPIVKEEPTSFVTHMLSDNSDDDQPLASKSTTRGRGRGSRGGRARATTTPRARGRGRGTRTKATSISYVELDSD